MSKMLNCRVFFLCGLFLAFAGIAPAVAQDCGNECSVCNEDWHEGTSYKAGGWYDMDCVSGGGCSTDLCKTVQVVSDATPAALDIVHAVMSATGAHLSSVVEEYGDHLLMHSARNLLAIRGTGCDPNAITSVVFLGPVKTEALAHLGVRRLTDFYAQLRAEIGNQR